MRYALILLLLLAGCATTKPTVLLDDEIMFIIPANTPFKAYLDEDNKVLQDFTRKKDTWCMDASKVIKLQEEANKCVMNSTN